MYTTHTTNTSYCNLACCHCSSFNLSTMELSAELWLIVKQLQEGDQFDEIICNSLSCLMFNALWLMHTIDADDPDKV